MQLRIAKECRAISPAKPGDNSSLEERRRLYDNMQDATIGGGVCTDLERRQGFQILVQFKAPPYRGVADSPTF